MGHKRAASRTIPISRATRQWLDKLFAADGRGQAAVLLAEQFGFHEDEKHAAYMVGRLRIAALKLSQGDLERLRRAVACGKVDCQDLLTTVDV
jgi:hypothetical protein